MILCGGGLVCCDYLLCFVLDLDNDYCIYSPFFFFQALIGGPNGNTDLTCLPTVTGKQNGILNEISLIRPP